MQGTFINHDRISKVPLTQGFLSLQLKNSNLNNQYIDFKCVGPSTLLKWVQAKKAFELNVSSWTFIWGKERRLFTYRSKNVCSAPSPLT